MTINLKPEIFQSSSNLKQARAKFNEKSTKLEELIGELNRQKELIDNQIESLDRQIERWRSEAADSFEDMIAESDVVDIPTGSDHNHIYCTIKSEYIKRSPAKTEQSAGSSSGSESSW